MPIHFNIRFLLVLVIILFFGCGYNQRPLNQVSPLINVLLFEGQDIQIKPFKNYILSANSRKEMGEGTVYVSLSNNMFVINGMAIEAENLEIIPSESFEFKGKKYRGSLKIDKTGSKLQLINIIDIESYLYGVLPQEVSPNWDAQALQAQAVVSRTFALFEMVSARKGKKNFDLYADTRSQVYSGMNEESKNTTLAVDATYGEIVRYQGKVIQSFFHASSGGMTESSKDVFGDEKAYLSPVTSSYSTIYPGNQWETTLKINQLEKALNLKNGFLSLNVTERTDSKRIKTIEIFDKSSNKTTISGKDLRSIAGETAMKSTRANIHITNDFILITGVGYGHGVGMGQWDALGMAKKGIQYRDIITYFYRGTSIDKLW